MTQALFRIGGVYRQACGGIRKLAAHGTRPERCFALMHLGDGMFSSIVGGDGARNLSDGRYIWHSGPQDDYLTLIPGELHNFNGQWLPVEEKAEQPMAPYFAEALRSHTLKPVLAPIPEDMVAPDDGWLDDWMSDSANAAMIARDSEGFARSGAVPVAPPPVAQEATSHAPLAGLTVLMERDHRFGLGR